MSNAQETPTYGCVHYKRKCAFVAPCCQKVYNCRVCHNEQEKHEIDRHAVQEITCLKCSARQSVSKECNKCQIEFGKYFCEVCRLYDDEDKQQFHCAGCGICRVGGRENFFHCENCNSCLRLSMKADHKCVENASHSNCPICLEDLHSSRQTVEVPRCGHFIHHSCFVDMRKHGTFACPLCGESYGDMKRLWELMDVEVANTQMPDEYKDFKLQILCKDCHKESEVSFHVIGLKCQECGSYNTCRAGNPDDNPSTTLPVPPPPPPNDTRESTDTDQEPGNRETEESAEELLHV